MIFIEETIDSEMIYEGKVINLRKDKVKVISGESYREVIEHKGAVCVLAMTDDNKIVMVKQYRKPAKRVMLEIPAGKIDEGEKPLDAAYRELKEETGFTPKEIKELFSFYPAVGYSEEVIYLYIARGLEPGETDFDETEAIDIEFMDLEILYQMVVDKKIQDGKTIMAILYGKLNLAI